MVRELTRLELAESGYTVIEARNGREALEAFAQAPRPVHLLVTDVVMPELGGQELFKLLSVKRPDLRCLYVSGYSESVVTGSGQAGPGTAYLEKPYTPEALLQKVCEILDSAGGG